MSCCHPTKRTHTFIHFGNIFFSTIRGNRHLFERKFDIDLNSFACAEETQIEEKNFYKIGITDYVTEVCFASISKMQFINHSYEIHTLSMVSGVAFTLTDTDAGQFVCCCFSS